MVSSTTAAIALTLTFFGVVSFLGYRRVTKGQVKAYDPKTGIGRGAPGFQTNVARVAVPAHIIARIRAGEEVSAEEITAAQEEEKPRQEREAAGKKVKPARTSAMNVGNEWLPDSATASPGGRRRGKR